MALHSGNTSKKAVATQLAKVLTTQVRARAGRRSTNSSAPDKLRQDLSGYAAAMNETREPLQRSLHDVLGRIVQLTRRGEGAFSWPLRPRLRGHHPRSLGRGNAGTAPRGRSGQSFLAACRRRRGLRVAQTDRWCLTARRIGAGG